MNLQKKVNILNLEKEKSDTHTEKYTHSHVLALKQQQLFMSVNETFIVFSLILCEVRWSSVSLFTHTLQNTV